MKKLLVLFFGLFLFASCESTDLIVLQRPGQEDRTDNEAFCNLDGDEIVIRVKNVGNMDSPAVDVLVEFPPSFPSQTLTTAPIPAMSEVEVRLNYPPGCFNSDCNYKITIDPSDTVDESREDNNVQEAICIG